MLATGVVILAHGSRGERGKDDVEAALNSIAVGLKPMLSPGVEIVGAALQFNQPDLEEAVAALSAKGVNRIIIAPYFLFAGRHVTEHLPQLIEKIQPAYPGTRFLITDNLGADRSFTGLIARRIRETAPDLTPTRAGLSGSIEEASLKIVDTLLPPLPHLSDREVTVVKRIVHACGDSEVARLIRFSQSAISEGISAIAEGSPIFTDVRMVLAGIDSRLAEGFGCSVSCALDETVIAGECNITRTAAAMAHLGDRIKGAIVVIGNAPTGLLALLELIDDKGIRPALIVGMPVGFVQAEESKQELVKREIPYITVMGTRGGSAVAAATVNSLLRMATRDDPCKLSGKAKGGMTEC